MKVRMYYLFKIKPEMYKENANAPENIYKILESIYMMSNDDIVLGYKMFDKLCITIDKHNINKLIKDLNLSNDNYRNINSTHMINDYMRNENTKMIINNSHIKIKSDAEYPCFFNNLKSIPNIFVCDFINTDYFFLKKIEPTPEIETLSCVTT